MKRAILTLLILGAIVALMYLISVKYPDFKLDFDNKEHHDKWPVIQ